MRKEMWGTLNSPTDTHHKAEQDAKTEYLSIYSPQQSLVRGKSIGCPGGVDSWILEKTVHPTFEG